MEEEGKPLPGPNFQFLGEYEASKVDILHNRLNVGVKGHLFVDVDVKASEEENETVSRRLEGYDPPQES